MDHFEKELKQALERRPAPPSLKRKIMQRRGVRSVERHHTVSVMWQRLAASIALAAVLGGVMEWQLRQSADRRKGEEARRQVMTALRITGRALNEVNERLAAHNRGDE